MQLPDIHQRDTLSRDRDDRPHAVVRALVLAAATTGALALLTTVRNDGTATSSEPSTTLSLFIAHQDDRYVFQLDNDDLRSARCTSSATRFVTRPLRMTIDGIDGAYQLGLAWTLPDGLVRRAYEASVIDADSAAVTAQMIGTSDGAPAQHAFHGTEGLLRLDPGGRGWFEAVLSDGRHSEIIVAGNWTCGEGG